MGEEAHAIVLGEPNLETQFVFEQAGIPLPEVVTSLPAGTEVVLVDHNEASQSIEGRDTLIVDTVIDHHKVADFVTAGPVKMRLEKVGCTCTILAEIFIEHGYTPAPAMALLMISAIVSDTLYYRSPTTTERDKKAVEHLIEIAGITDLETYSMDMFASKSDLGDMPAEDIVTMDYKTFDFYGKTMGIGVLETTNP
jgi:manganese-dependent inorganic pyrophosphatase